MDELQQIRLLVGDNATDTSSQLLSDDVYQFLLDEANGDKHQAAIDALEAIINEIALSPARWELGDAMEERASLPALERRLSQLKAKADRAKNAPVPVLIRSDRKDWSDFNAIFGKEDK